MARRSSRINNQWETPKDDFRWEHVIVEVLQDIRTELQAINRLLHCDTTTKAFTKMIDVAHVARRIDKRLAQTRKLKGGRNAGR
jgi:hypothetical protein